MTPPKRIYLSPACASMFTHQADPIEVEYILAAAHLAQAAELAEARAEVARQAEVPCNVCNGVGWLTLDDAEIVRRTCEEARRVYWSAFEARISA